MANKSLFKSLAGKLAPKADTRNEAGGTAYAFDARHALAQYAATGTLNGTFYASAHDQLETVLGLCGQVESEFIARTALYTRTHGYMKDLPALLCAVLSVRGPGLLAEVFDRVIDSPKMLRNFVQIMRSGVVGRKSLGSLPKRLIVDWLDKRTDAQVFFGSVGNDPSLADIIKMVHPKPANASRDALYGYLIGRPIDREALPEIVKQFEAYKSAKDRRGLAMPDVPFQMLTGLDLADWEWKAIARQAPWQMTRMNLNTFARHGVFGDQKLTRTIANRLRDVDQVRKARCFPYQLLMAYGMSDALPHLVREALQDAMEAALENVPAIDGRVIVCPDVSGSMHSPATGYRKGATSAVRCIDIAGLVAAALLRKNPGTLVLPFESDVVTGPGARLNPRDSVMTNARKLASLPSGGTNCSAPLRYLNQRKEHGDLVVYVSDNESWIDTPRYGYFGGGATETMRQWELFKQRNPAAKMVCIDIQPYGHTQAKEREEITNVGGFSDQVFKIIAAAANGQSTRGRWVSQVEAMTL
ncbi:MAG: RNA-binding protein [Phycisphaerales bacterium JB063]